MAAAATDKALTTTDGPPLSFLDVELTERCNLECTHCYIRRPLLDGEATAREMPTEFLNDVLTQARALGCSSVRFTGGEPLVRNDFARVYAHAVGLGFHVALATNATTLTERVADLLVEQPPSDIGISMYGWDGRSYLTVTNRPAFEPFLDGVRRLRRRAIPFKLKYPAVPLLLRNEHRLHQLARELGYSETMPRVWELTLHAWNDQREGARIAPLRLSPARAARQRLRDPEFIARDLEKLAVRRRARMRLFQCPAAKGIRMNLNAYGQLQPCLEMRHPRTLVDLRIVALRAGALQLVRDVRAMKPTEAYNARCGKCVLRPACVQCPAVSWTENGALDTPSTFHCRVTHHEMVLLGALKGGERGWEVSATRPVTRAPRWYEIWWRTAAAIIPEMKRQLSGP